MNRRTFLKTIAAATITVAVPSLSGIANAVPKSVEFKITNIEQCNGSYGNFTKLIKGTAVEVNDSSSGKLFMVEVDIDTSTKDVLKNITEALQIEFNRDLHKKAA